MSKKPTEVELPNKTLREATSDPIRDKFLQISLAGGEILCEHLDKVDGYEVRLSILQYASIGLRHQAPLPPLLSNFIADGLERLSKGATLESAFGMKRKRGERNLQTQHSRQIDLAVAVELERKRGNTLEVARAIVAEKSEVIEDTVHKAWRLQRKTALELIRLSNAPRDKTKVEDAFRKISEYSAPNRIPPKRAK